MTRHEAREARTVRRRSWWGVVVPLVLAGPVVLALAVVDSARVTSKESQSRVRFGMPLNWLSQDQSGFDPPFPDTATFSSIWEYPTSVSVGALVVDVVGVLAVLVGAWLLVRVSSKSSRIGRTP